MQAVSQENISLKKTLNICFNTLQFNKVQLPSGTFCNFGAIFSKKKYYVVMVICCYYKYGYCYYCSPDKVGFFLFLFCFYYIVIWRPAGQRHYMTMVEMNPSLYSECDESVQELGAET